MGKNPTDKRMNDHAETVAALRKNATRVAEDNDGLVRSASGDTLWLIVTPGAARTVVWADSAGAAYREFVKLDTKPFMRQGGVVAEQKVPYRRDELVIRAATAAEAVEFNKRRPRVDHLAQHGGELFPEVPRERPRSAEGKAQRKAAPTGQCNATHQAWGRCSLPAGHGGGQHHYARKPAPTATPPDPALGAALAERPGDAGRPPPDSTALQGRGRGAGAQAPVQRASRYITPSGQTAPLPGKVRRDAPDTARKAALAVTPRTGTQRHAVLASILQAHRDGATDEELQTALAMNPSTQRPRRVELVEGGFVVDSGKRRPSRSGNASIVWVATEFAPL